MQCKCGREAKRHEKKTPEGIYKKYTRLECACGITTPWCYSECGTLNDYLRDEWEKTQREMSACPSRLGSAREVGGQRSAVAELTMKEGR